MILRSSLCDYSDTYIIAKETIAVANIAAKDQTNNVTNKKVTFENYAPFTNCVSKINKTQVDDAHDIDVVIPMYNVIGYRYNYSKTFGILWQYWRNALNF